MTRPAEVWDKIEPFFAAKYAHLLNRGAEFNTSSDIYVIKLYDSSKKRIKEYSFSEAGFIGAIAAAATGDSIHIPAGTLTLTAAFTIPDGVTVTGDGPFSTIIVANGNYGNLCTLSEDIEISNLQIQYTSSSADPVCLKINPNGHGMVVKNVHAYLVASTALTAACFQTSLGSSFRLIESCIMSCTGNGGTRIGIDVEVMTEYGEIRDTYAYGQANVNPGCNCYGIYGYLSGAGSLLIWNCYGYGYAQGGQTGYGIFLFGGTVQAVGCYGKGESGTAVSIGLETQNSARAFSCYGYANNDGGGTSYALVLNGGFMYACSGEANSGNKYGLATWGTSYAIGCRFNGATYDILLNTSCVLHVYACQYDTTTGAGTIVKDTGDLSLGTGTDNRIVQWNGAGGLLEDSKLVGPATNLLNISNGGANATLDLQILGGKTLSLIASDNRTITFPGNGTAALCSGTEAANRLAYWTAAAALDDMPNGTGYLYNDGAGAFSYVPLAEAPAWDIQIDGVLATATDVGAFVSPGDGTILAVYIRCKTQGSANSTIIDCHLNGTTIFTTQANRPTLAWNEADGYAKSGTPELATLAEGDILTFDIDAIATSAADLSIILAVKWASISVAPIDARYVVGASNGTLSNEIVKDYLEDNYDPDAYPSSPNAMDDEFEGGGAIDVKWTKVNDPAGADAMNQTDYPGFLHVRLTELGTDNFDNAVRLYQAPPVWSEGAWEFVAKANIIDTGLAGEGAEYAGVFLYLGNSTDDEFVGAATYLNDSALASFVWRRSGSAADNGSGGFGGMTTNREHAIQPGQEIYLKLKKTTTGSNYDQPNTYEAYTSIDGIIYEQVGTISKDFTHICNEIGLIFRRPKSQTGTPYAEATVDFFRRTV
ncbi:MAG: hypothetical protein PHV98_00770 [Candidatus Omnitrophica bacterium]|nr:hypothetical protein [Candidatus Omnitrophota bacterium]